MSFWATPYSSSPNNSWLPGRHLDYDTGTRRLKAPHTPVFFTCLGMHYYVKSVCEIARKLYALALVRPSYYVALHSFVQATVVLVRQAGYLHYFIIEVACCKMIMNLCDDSFSQHRLINSDTSSSPHIKPDRHCSSRSKQSNICLGDLTCASHGLCCCFYCMVMAVVVAFNLNLLVCIPSTT